MAPECLSDKDYNLKADVYSFSIILWEILTARTPYAFVRRRHQLINYVVEENGRPDIDESWPTSIQGMLESSFDSEIDKRPVSQLLMSLYSCKFVRSFLLIFLCPSPSQKMTLWYDIIRETLVTLRGGDRTGLSDTLIRRRRSFGSMIDLMSGLNDSGRRALKELADSGNCSASGSRRNTN